MRALHNNISEKVFAFGLLHNSSARGERGGSLWEISETTAVIRLQIAADRSGAETTTAVAEVTAAADGDY